MPVEGVLTSTLLRAALLGCLLCSCSECDDATGADGAQSRAGDTDEREGESGVDGAHAGAGGDGTAGDGSGDGTAGDGSGDGSGDGTAGDGTGAAGDTGEAGSGAGAGAAGGVFGPGATTLNPAMCMPDAPFTLVIDTKGRWGRIGGWLETTADVAFEDGLPNFAPEDMTGLGVWWSVASPEDGYFYGWGETDIALAPVPDRFEAIDVASLAFGSETLGPLKAGAIVVHKYADELLAVRVDAVYVTGEIDAFQCTAIDATWVFVTRGPGGKLSFGEPE